MKTFIEITSIKNVKKCFGKAVCVVADAHFGLGPQ